MPATFQGSSSSSSPARRPARRVTALAGPVAVTSRFARARRRQERKRPFGVGHGIPSVIYISQSPVLVSLLSFLFFTITYVLIFLPPLLSPSTASIPSFFDSSSPSRHHSPSPYTRQISCYSFARLASWSNRFVSPIAVAPARRRLITSLLLAPEVIQSLG